ncbi:hypothetical protein AB0H83_31860 [Dactylosporangium sp. NPDC050688]|uniref:hypothetical protein n=1 Tax=Dactylosporangium sp. NPDC050688 TaxID=3157217 RepID=UPI0033D3FB39
MGEQMSQVKILLVVIAILVGIIAGLVAAVLSRMNGDRTAAAISKGGIAFGGTVPLVLLIENTLAS